MRPHLPAAMAAILFAAIPAAAQTARPTPDQMLDAVLQPVQTAVAQLAITDAERQHVADLLARGEALAADVVAARQHGDTVSAQAVSRQIELLARVVRGRIEAERLETHADELERAALTADERRVQARATLERAAERALESERQSAAPAPAPTPAPAAEPPAPQPAAAPPAPHPAGHRHAPAAHPAHGGRR